MKSEPRQYKDVSGNPCSLDWLVKNEPEWAANQIRHRDTIEAELQAANEDVLLHSMLRVELTAALKLDSLKPRTRQGNSELVALVDERKS